MLLLLPTPTCFFPSSLPYFLPSLLTPRLPTRSRGAEEALELLSGFKEGAAFYTSVVRELSAVAEQAGRISDRRERERAAFKKRAAAPPPPPPPSTTGGRAQVAAATAFMAPSNTPSYPGAASNTPVVGVRQSAAPSYAAAPSYPTATPYAPQYQAQPQRPQPQSAPPKIGCCNCRKVFAVPAGSKIVACPYCGTHNRVPT